MRRKMWNTCWKSFCLSPSSQQLNSYSCLPFHLSISLFFFFFSLFSLSLSPGRAERNPISDRKEKESSREKISFVPSLLKPWSHPTLSKRLTLRCILLWDTLHIQHETSQKVAQCPRERLQPHALCRIDQLCSFYLLLFYFNFSLRWCCMSRCSFLFS